MDYLSSSSTVADSSPPRLAGMRLGCTITHLSILLSGTEIWLNGVTVTRSNIDGELHVTFPPSVEANETFALLRQDILDHLRRLPGDWR